MQGVTGVKRGVENRAKEKSTNNTRAARSTCKNDDEQLAYCKKEIPSKVKNTWLLVLHASKLPSKPYPPALQRWRLRTQTLTHRSPSDQVIVMGSTRRFTSPQPMVEQKKVAEKTQTNNINYVYVCMYTYKKLYSLKNDTFK